MQGGSCRKLHVPLKLSNTQGPDYIQLGALGSSSSTAPSQTANQPALKTQQLGLHKTHTHVHTAKIRVKLYFTF